MFTDFQNAVGFGPTGYGQLLMGGMAVTVLTAVASSCCALVMGIVLGCAACSKYGLARFCWRIYRSVFASIPTLLVLFFIYFGVPYAAAQSFGVDVQIGPFTAGLCGLSLIYATYVAEIVRGAVFAVPKGQYEACRALGLGPLPTWGRVVVPQVARIARPGLLNTWVVLLKDTALVSVIGVADVVRVGQIAGSSTGRPLAYLAVVGFFFVAVVTLSLALIGRRRGRRAAIGRGAL